MFCDTCGKEIAPGAAFCATCGKVIGSTPRTAGQGRVAKHVQIVAILWLVASMLRLMGGLAVLVVGSMFLPGMIGGMGWPLDRLVPGIVSSVAIGLTLVAIVGIGTGWGLLQRESWARGVALVLGVLALFNFPLGTALGIYTLWVLLPRESAQEYARMTAH